MIRSEKKLNLRASKTTGKSNHWYLEKLRMKNRCTHIQRLRSFLGKSKFSRGVMVVLKKPAPKLKGRARINPVTRADRCGY